MPLETRSTAICGDRNPVFPGDVDYLDHVFRATRPHLNSMPLVISLTCSTVPETHICAYMR